MTRSRAPRLRLAALLAACLLALAAAGPVAARAGRSYATPASLRELVSGWTPSTHLYVLGDVGLEPAVLAGLEERLAGTHWTVVLVADAAGETWKDFEGIVRDGADAVEYATGQGIPRRKGFADQRHPETGEPDGTVLAIVLAQRALYYVGSEAQDARGLGDEAFAGTLDQWAIQALRNGGDVVGAVTGTVANVDRLLAAKIGEARAAEERRLREARQAVDKVAAELAALEAAVAALRRSFPSLDGPVARPDLAGFAADVEEARAAAATDPARASRLAGVVGQKVEAALAVARAYPKDGEALVAASATLDRLASRPGAAKATTQIAAAREAVARARELWETGEPAYRQRLAKADEAVDAAKQAVDQIEAGALMLRSCLFAVLSMAGLGGLVLLVVASRRRRPAKLEAEALLASWRQALDRKLEALVDELERRMERWVGPVTGEGRRPWAGETRRLADGIRADVGSLAILWTSANGVLTTAQGLVEPGGLAALGNLARSGRYRRAIALLKDEPVEFDPGEGLPAIFGGARTWRDDLLGGLQSYQPFRKSFAELIAEFDERAGRAADALERVETAVRGADARLDTAGAALDRAEAQAVELARAGAADGLLRVPALAGEALPAGRSALSRARALVADDPVGAIAGPGALAEGIAGAAERLAAGLAEARALQLPDIAAARFEIGAALGLPPERMLREEGADPSALLAEAAERADEAALALGRGDLTTAEGAIAEAGRLAAEAREVVEASRRSLAGHEETAQRERAEGARLAALLPDRERTLERLERGFPPSALALRAGDPEHPSANGTVADNLAEAREHLETAQAELRAADVARREGRLLEAAAGLERVAGLHALAGHRLDEIAETAARLDRTLTENAANIAALERRLAAGEREIAGDPRVTAPTVRAFAAVCPRVAAARAATGPTADPFAVADELAAIAAALDEIETRAAPRDRERHAAAGRSLAEAERQLAVAADLARRAAGDAIPDSAEIVAARRELEKLVGAGPVASLRSALAVPHGDWDALAAEADALVQRIAVLVATLRGELARGEAAAAALSHATAEVRGASLFRGAWGVVIGGSPGGRWLASAGEHLDRGLYDAALDAAEAARREAAAAIAAAEAEVRRRQHEEDERRRAEQRRRDAERQRRAAEESARQQRASWSSGGGSGGTSSGHSSGGRSGWSGSSSGSGRSSFSGGSRSGAGKSGW